MLQGRMLKLLVTVVVCGVVALALPLQAAPKLVVWAWANDEVIRQWSAQLEWYQEENPGIEFDVAHISGDQRVYLERLYVAMAASAAPDVTWLDGGHVKQLAAQGLLADLTGALRGLNFTPGELQEVTYNGRQYAAPYHSTSRGLVKRIDNLSEAGLDYNEDPLFDDLVSWNQKLSQPLPDGTYKRIGFAPWFGNWDARGWIWAFGGDLVEETNGGFRPTAMLPSNLQAYEWIDEWAARYGRIKGPVAGGANFVTGTLGMTIASTTNAANYVRDKVAFTTSPVPHPPQGRKVTWGGGYVMGMPSEAANKAEAAKLLAYFASPRVQARRWNEFQALLPANWDAIRMIASRLDRVYEPLLALLPDAVPRAPMDGEWYRALAQSTDLLIAGRLAPQEALERAQIVMAARFEEVFGK
jgi:ABC-type glycerol-3-phosphate transport system substrate-binding protein